MISRCVRFLTSVIVFFMWSLNKNSSSGMVSAVNKEPWYSKLPDYYLHGIPKLIVNNEYIYMPAFKFGLTVFGVTGKPSRIEKARRFKKAQELIPDSVPFPCPISGMRSASRPTSVHAIRPGDIDVVGALGDSLTAGFAALATNFLEYVDENRGVTALIGGQGTWREFTTLPNLLKVINPKLIGYSSMSGISADIHAGFNMAESGAMYNDLYHMVRILVDKIKNSSVDFENDWKMISISIGTNNLCSDTCWVKNFTENIEEHRQHILKTFRYLRDNMPRTIVNFMQTVGIHYLKRDPFPTGKCQLLHDVACSCLFGRQRGKKLPLYLDMARKWQEVDEEVFSYAEFRNRDDFVILLQPVLTDLIAPTIIDPATGRKVVDLNYWGPDCFHWSQRFNSKLAVASWNSLFTPDGAKSKNVFSIADKFVCPNDENPYICTWKNNCKL